jgi:nucleoside-diphosphate-sugar epimerase
MRVLVTGGSGFIGTNLVDILLDKGAAVLNLDINPPKKGAHAPCWKKCDIMDFERTSECIAKFQPDYLIHLAARTDTLSENLEDYRVNTEGTNRILSCIRDVSSIQRVIITSSQFAFAPPGLPSHDEEYNPIGAYGMSKVLAEKATREAGLDCTWTIVRPTNIWGPWHPRYPKEFWLVLKRGLYFHPGGKSTIRSYGYVKNIIDQMLKILEASPSLVHGKMYYLGDPPMPLVKWTNGFSIAITGKPVRTLPRPFLVMLATVGSLLKSVGIPFPITRSRYRSMTEDYFSPIEKTIQAFGPPPYSLEEGIRETVEWLNEFWNGQAHQTGSPL